MLPATVVCYRSFWGPNTLNRYMPSPAAATLTLAEGAGEDSDPYDSVPLWNHSRRHRWVKMGVNRKPVPRAVHGGGGG